MGRGKDHHTRVICCDVLRVTNAAQVGRKGRLGNSMKLALLLIMAPDSEKEGPGGECRRASSLVRPF